MNLPNFLCVGAQKSGTTTLQEILIQHPNIYLPKRKETHFFDNGDIHYAKGISWYSSEYFSAVKHEQAIGEISTNYMFLDYVPKRIYEELGPDIKLIFILRDPAKRAYSQFMMNKQNFFETETFETALELENKRILKDEYHKKIFGYATRGLYAEQIKRFLEYFPREQMFFIIFETDFLDNKEQTMQELCHFLELSPYDFQLDIKKNIMSRPGYKWVHDILYSPTWAWIRRPFKFFIDSEQKREWIKFKIRGLNKKKITSKESTSIKRETYVSLQKYFLNDIQLLEEITHKDLSHWTYQEKEK